ncbi:MAG: ABC transporter permease [Armatimonadota bacterium]|nr:ABC transporter permease [Armatimonadota bacterium]MDR5696868.1 ABC transporter permease [Armatimonadota bacterium]
MNAALAAVAPPRTARRLRFASAALGGAVVGALVVLAALADVLAPHDPRALSGPLIAPPSVRHPMGTNDLGQDLLSTWLHGARVSLGVGFAAALLSTTLSGAVGILSVTSRPARAVLLGLTDVLLATPNLPLLVLAVTLMGPATWHLVPLLALVSWPAYARVVRAQTAATVQYDYVLAARAAGATPGRIVRTCLLPEVLPLLWTKFLLTTRWAILMEAVLALMGLSDPTRVSWGSTLSGAFAYPLLFVGNAWLWWALPPALAIAAVTLALSAIGQDFELWLNPAARLRRL